MSVPLSFSSAGTDPAECCVKNKRASFTYRSTVASANPRSPTSHRRYYADTSAPPDRINPPITGLSPPRPRTPRHSFVVGIGRPPRAARCRQEFPASLAAINNARLVLGHAHLAPSLQPEG